MKINIKFFISGIIFRFLPEIFNLNNGLDYNSKIVLGMTLTMVFFLVNRGYTNFNNCINSYNFVSNFY